jgi:DNA-binding CsgD family transcriptional regulator
MDSRRQAIGLTIIIALIMIFTAGDMLADMDEGSSFAHVSMEGVLLTLSLAGIAWIWQDRFKLAIHAKGLASDLKGAREDAARWRHEAEGLMVGLSAAIDMQFDAWKLTPAEKEVGFLLLKGLALKEAAGVRGTSERTVRQQAQEIYRKAGLGSRSEFAAFFLEDLLTPQTRTTVTQTRSPPTVPQAT